MMKHIFYLCMAVIMTATIFTSCEKVDEVPPRSDSSTSTKIYKLPDPERLSTDELKQVNAIKSEYASNVANVN